METYNQSLDQMTLPSVRKSWGDKIKGENNGAYGHSGRYSPYSKKFVKYDRLSDEEKDAKIDGMYSHLSETHKNNQNMPNQVGYWMKQGYSEEESIERVSERQTTFSLDKCIERLGETEGRRRWKERQVGWQHTLNSKPPEEIERINKSKFTNTGYSKVSQKLFWSLYELCKNDYEHVFFAEKDMNNGINGEYCLITEDKKVFLLDFFVKDTGKIIEFDGDYWHGEKRGNQERDRLREEKIRSMGYMIHRVKERDFNNNPQKVLQECIKYVYD